MVGKEPALSGLSGPRDSCMAGSHSEKPFLCAQAAPEASHKLLSELHDLGILEDPNPQDVSFISHVAVYEA